MSGDDDYSTAVNYLRDIMPVLAEKLRLVAEVNPSLALRYVAGLSGTVEFFAEPVDRATPNPPAPAPPTPHRSVTQQVPADNEVGEIPSQEVDNPSSAQQKEKREAVPRHVFEFAVLSLLRHRNGIRTDKKDIFDALIGIQLAVGEPGAFNTRLNKLKTDGLVDWEMNRKNAPVFITAEGNERCTKLASPGYDALKPEQLDWFISRVNWAPNRERLLGRVQAMNR